MLVFKKHIKRPKNRSTYSRLDIYKKTKIVPNLSSRRLRRIKQKMDCHAISLPKGFFKLLESNFPNTDFTQKR